MTPTLRPDRSPVAPWRAASTSGGSGWSTRGGVERVVPADDLVQQRRVEDGAGDRADLVERVGHRDQPVAGDPAVRRLHTHGAGDGAGLADRATGVGAERQRRLERGDRGRGAAAGTAGDALEVPRVVRGAVGGVLGGGAHRELVHVGLAQDRQARSLQARHDRGVVRRDPALEDLRAAGGRQAGGGQHVLDRDRDPVERGGGGAGGAAGVGLGGRGQRALGVDVEVGVHGAVDGSVARRAARVSSTEVVSPAARARAISSALARVRSMLTARPPGSAAP